MINIQWSPFYFELCTFFLVIIALSPELSEFANFEISVRFIALHYNSAYIRSFQLHSEGCQVSFVHVMYNISDKSLLLMLL